MKGGAPGGGWGVRAAPWLSQFSYAPWVVANLHLRATPDANARCDNVLYGGRGLGYTLSHAPRGLLGRLLFGGGSGSGGGGGGSGGSGGSGRSSGGRPWRGILVEADPERFQQLRASPTTVVVLASVARPNCGGPGRRRRRLAGRRRRARGRDPHAAGRDDPPSLLAPRDQGRARCPPRGLAAPAPRACARAGRGRGPWRPGRDRRSPWRCGWRS